MLHILFLDLVCLVEVTCPTILVYKIPLTHRIELYPNVRCHSGVRLLFESLFSLQTQTSSNVVEDINIVVDTSESTLARSLSKDRDISK